MEHAPSTSPFLVFPSNTALTGGKEMKTRQAATTCRAGTERQHMVALGIFQPAEAGSLLLS